MDTEKKKKKRGVQEGYSGCYTSLPSRQKETLYERFKNKGATLKWILVGLYLLSETEFKKVTDMLEVAHTRNNERLKSAS